MPPMSSTLDVSKRSGSSNAVAPLNMSLMSLTLDVSKSSGRSNTAASWNMPLMSVTLDVSKLNSWSNAAAPLNMSAMSLTLAVPKLGCSLSSRGERTVDERALRAVATTSTSKLSGELNTSAP
eukprot:scaffold25147_cov91-Phaeocystis_antarctica.AAC.2